MAAARGFAPGRCAFWPVHWINLFRVRQGVKNDREPAESSPVDDHGGLRELLADPDALVMAFDPLGGAIVPMPASFGVSEDRLVNATSPLDVLADSAQGAAVVAYEGARRSGHGTAHVTLVDGDDRAWWLEIFDFTDAEDCFIGVIVPDHAATGSGRLATSLAPRRCEYTLGVTGIIESINPAFTAMLGWDADEVVGESSMNFIHPDDHEGGIVQWIDLLEAPGAMTRIRQRFRKKNGSWLWCESTDCNMLDDPVAPHVLGEILDISREVVAESALQRRETVLDRLYRALPTGVLVLDPDGAVAAENERWRTLTGGGPGVGIDALLERVVDRAEVAKALAAAAVHGHDSDVAIDLDGDGVCRHGDLHVRPLDEKGQHVGLLVTLDDTTEERIQAAAIAAQTRLDPLTGSLNRRGLDDELTEQLGTDRDLAVLYLDLDDFKSINDTYGHARGDQVLREVTSCIEANVPTGTIVARMGGDEFLVVLMDDTTTIDEITGRITNGIAELRETFAPHTDFGVSIGHAHRRELDDFDSLIARADGAMYALKPRRRRLGDTVEGMAQPRPHDQPATALSS